MTAEEMAEIQREIFEALVSGSPSAIITNQSCEPFESGEEPMIFCTVNGVEVMLIVALV